MGSRIRTHFVGAVYHVMSRGVQLRDIYQDDNDRITFLGILERTQTEMGAQLLAYCLMGNHFHLVVKVSQSPLSRMMQRILSSYARGFNERSGLEGHLFQARYRAILCTDDRYLSTLIRYVHLNPVRAGLVSHAGDWPWSSHRAYQSIGKNGLVELTSDLPTLDSEPAPGFDPWRGADVAPNLLRSPEAARLSLKQIARQATADGLVNPADLSGTSRRRPVARARKLFADLAARSGYSLTEIAAELGVSVSAISHALKQFNNSKPDERSEMLTAG